MESNIRTQLETVIADGSPYYQETARKLLAGELTWSREELNQFLDGFMNDPYLTRNIGD